MGPPAKRSLTLRGHRTSVSLEDEFWRAFREIARAENERRNAETGLDWGLSAVYVLLGDRPRAAEVIRRLRTFPDPEGLYLRRWVPEYRPAGH